MLCRIGRKLHWYLTPSAEQQRKFHAPKIAATYSEAVDMLLSNHVLPLGQHDDARAFREKHLYFEEVDLVYRQYLPQIDALFDSWDPDGSGMLELKELTRVLKGQAAP